MHLCVGYLDIDCWAIYINMEQVESGGRCGAATSCGAEAFPPLVQKAVIRESLGVWGSKISRTHPQATGDSLG